MTSFPLPFRGVNRLLLGISPKQVSFSRRGFPGGNVASLPHLQKVIQTFVDGYNIALDEPDTVRLAGSLNSAFTPELVGFAYEGAGLYFALLDLLVPRSKSRLAMFTGSVATNHDYIATVGAGFAFGRVPFGASRLESYQRKLDPAISWCLADGYGFHQGFFHWRRFIADRAPAPTCLSPQNRRLFDAGVGRAMWWVFGADPAAIAAAIFGFDKNRQGDMWTGIGTALGYAGAGPAQTSRTLLDLAGPHSLEMLSGLPLAARMREKGGNPARWTEATCLELLSLTAAETSDLVVTELATYLNSWQGLEHDKWSNFSVAVRELVMRRLENILSEDPDSAH
jgi:hypothetical protein